MTNAAAAPMATRREWTGLAVIALPCMLATMDLTVLNLAVPQLSEELKPTSSQLLWIVDIYGFLIAGSLITMGTLGDRIGRRKLLLIGAFAFGIASALAAFSRSAAMLIFTRALLGVAGATLAPSTLSLIRNMFLDPRERTTAIAIWVTCFSVGATIGPVLGGILLEHFHWGSVFLLNVPVMLLLLALGPVLLPEYKDPNAGKLDLGSAALSLSAVLLIIYGLKKTAESGLGAVPAAAVAAGAALAFLFVRRQRHIDYPLIDLRLFRSPAFSAALVLNFLGCFVAFGAFYYVSQYLQLVMGLSPLMAGLWSVPSSVAFTVGTMGTPSLVRRFRPADVIAGGLVLSAAGYALLAQVGPGAGLPLLVSALFVYSVGLSPIFTLSADLIVGTAPPERAGAAASMSETCTEFGGAVGMAVLGSLGTVIYRGRMEASMPAGLLPEAARAAQSTLGGAVDIAQHLPQAVGAALLEPARAAFTQALRLTAWIAVVVSMAMAVLALLMLRRTRAGGETAPSEAAGAKNPPKEIPA